MQMSIMSNLILLACSLLLLLQVTYAADGQICGANAGNTSCPLTGDPFAFCCSTNGFCGNSSAYCGTGCQSAFSATGKCTAPAPTAFPLTGNRCGKDPNTLEQFGVCQTSAYCCSPFGYCGIGDEYCVGCQAGKGYCPKQCDINTSFCGPVSKATFVMSLVGLVLSLLAFLRACLPKAG